MRVTGYATNWNADEGLMPIDIQDLIIEGTSDELKALSAFVARAAEAAQESRAGNAEFRETIDFPDDKPDPKTPICITVSHAA